MMKLIFTFLLLFVVCVNAGTIWDGGNNSNTNWSRVQNWSPNGVPGNGSNVSFGTGGSIATVDSNRTVGTITFNRIANFTINGTSTLTVNNGITTTQANIYTISSLLNLRGTNTWTTSTNSTLNINSAIVSNQSVIINGSGTVNLNTNNEQFGSFILNGGTVGLDYKTLTLDGNVTTTGGTIRISVLSETNHGQIIAGNTTTGNVSLGNGTTNLTLDSTGYTALDSDRIWLLINNSNGLTSGYFNGYNQGATVNVGGVNMYVFNNADYASGSLFGGNDILLAVPEPTTVLLFGIGSIFLLSTRRSIFHPYCKSAQTCSNRINYC